MSLMEQFANPDMIHSLTFGEKMTGSLVTMLMGMGTTFIVLMLLWGIIAVMTRMVNPKRVKSAEAAKQPAKAVRFQPAAPPSPVFSPAPVAEDSLDPAVIAVITAAIAAYEGGTGTVSNLNIRRISRASGQSPSWNSAGRRECIDSRRF